MAFDVQEFVRNLPPVDLSVKVPKKEFEERVKKPVVMMQKKSDF